MHTIPNFRLMSAPQLMDFWSTYHRPTRLGAELLIGDRRKGFTVVAAQLANYASNLAVTFGCAARGDYESAATYALHTALCIDRMPDDIQAIVRAQAGST